MPREQYTYIVQSYSLLEIGDRFEEEITDLNFSPVK
jgi:hypothetical protein